jgi:small subunit ribosomal protein S7
MPERRKQKQSLMRDQTYKSPLVSLLITKLLKAGKKSVAQRVVYSGFDYIRKKKAIHPIILFENAIKNLTPKVKVKSQRVAGSMKKIPTEIRPRQGLAIALKWLIQGSKTRGGQSFSLKLANEIIDAANRRGDAIKRKEQTHRMAIANRVHAHFRY